MGCGGGVGSLSLKDLCLAIHMLIVPWNEKSTGLKESSDEQWFVLARAPGEITMESYEERVCVCIVCMCVCMQDALVHTVSWAHLWGTALGSLCFIVVGPLMLNHVTFTTNGFIFLC